jgi:hypothetical protein
MAQVRVRTVAKRGAHRGGHARLVGRVHTPRRGGAHPKWRDAHAWEGALTPGEGAHASGGRRTRLVEREL